MTSRRTHGLALLLVLFSCRSSVAASGGLPVLGTLGGEAVEVSLEELLERPESFDGVWVVTEGVLFTLPHWDALCLGPEDEHLDYRCLWLPLRDGLARAGSLEQWHLGRVRVRARVDTRGGEPSSRPPYSRAAARSLSGIVLMEKNDGRFYLPEEVDLIPPPGSPHKYGGQHRELFRCGARDWDELGRVACLDRLEPWFWIENAHGFERFDVSRADEDPKRVELLMSLGEGRYALFSRTRGRAWRTNARTAPGRPANLGWLTIRSRG